MSGLEEQLSLAAQEAGALNQSVRDFYVTQKGLVDAKLAQVDAAKDDFPSAMLKRVHVDQINGDDDNAGFTDSPLRTIERAVSDHAIAYGQLEIVLLTDCTAEEARWEMPPGALVNVFSPTSARNVLTLVVLQHPGETDYEISGFLASSKAAPATVQFTNVHLRFPPEEQVRAMLPDNYSALLGSHRGSGPSLLGVQITDCTLEMPVAGEGCLLGAETRNGSLVVNFSSVIGSFAGSWVAGVPANTATVDLPNVISNIVTL